MVDQNVVTLKTDQQRADEIRAALKAPLTEIAAIMTQANRDGLKVDFALGINGFGRVDVPAVQVTKAL